MTNQLVGKIDSVVLSGSRGEHEPQERYGTSVRVTVEEATIHGAKLFPS